MQVGANTLGNLMNRASWGRFCGLGFWAASFLSVSGCVSYPVGQDQSLIEAADAATRRGDWLAAEDYWMRAVEELGSVNSRTHLETARALIELGHKERAQNRLDVGNTLFPDDADLRFMNGQLLRSRGYARAAEKNFQIAVRANPGHAEAWLGLAEVRLDLDLPEKASEAIEAYCKLVKVDPRASFVAGQVCARRGDLRRAMECFEKALADPLVGIDRLISAAATVTLERFESVDEDSLRQACSWVDRALARDPQESEASYVRGMILSRLGDDVGALEAYKRSVELSDHLLAMTRLAQVYARMGKLEEADRMIDRALELNVHASHRRMLERVRRAWH